MAVHSVFAEFERKRPTEDADIAEIVRGILTVQARNAAEQHRPLARGTHTKGIVVRAEFEVFDVARMGHDAAMAERLAKGVFAKPGVYPATVRFANAESRIFPDSHPDVRALSFSIDTPAGTVGDDPKRLDFSLNSATTFPINDAHAFAIFMRVRAAKGRVGALRALWSLSLSDLWLFFRTAFLAVGQQKHTPHLAYQQLRYWSNVPFRHGSGDAVKYSVTPDRANPAHTLADAQNFLQDELIRHVQNDQRMSAWDFGIQFLDPEAMTRWGMRRPASFWVENGAVEWNEEAAPFHTVGRLRLVHNGVVSPADGEAMYIDVTRNSTPDNEPLGSLNRARRSAERASRLARLTGNVEAPAPVPVRRSWLASLTRWVLVGGLGLVVLAWVAGIVYRGQAEQHVPPQERVDDIFYPDQGWGTQAASASRDIYYYTPQGAQMYGIRYSWFVALERPFRRERLADPDHMRQLNFIVDPFPTASNPDQLPVGFARMYDRTLNDYVVDVSCAACHTGQLNAKRNGRTTAIRIDGGQSMSAFTSTTPGSLLTELGGALGTTAANPLKFNRFARRVLGADATFGQKVTLWRQLTSVLPILAHQRFQGSFAPRLVPTEEGFGRVDAVTRISNVVFGDHLDPANYRQASGPASFPYLWNIWKFDWVQYGAFVSQPMARNMGEVMGTGAEFRLLDEFGRPVPPAERYRTTISIENLHRLESTLQTLKPPPWPEALLGSIDRAKAERGRALFEQRCIGCHGPHVAADALAHAISPLRGPGDPVWLIRLKALAQVGTDPEAANNLVGIRVDLRRSGLETGEVKALLRRELEQKKMRVSGLAAAIAQEIERRRKDGAPQSVIDELSAQARDAAYTNVDDQIASLDKLDLRSVPIGEGLTILGMITRQRYYADNHFSDAAIACYDGFGTLDLPQASLGYKPRPLEGVWATPPFLHNGSVPTLYDLLSPVAERPKTFYVGTRDFDPVKVGYVTAAPFPGAGGFTFDTTKAGNRNIGHEFSKNYVAVDDKSSPEARNQGGIIGPALSPEERLEIIEYLKIRRDSADGQPPHVPPDCSALLSVSTGNP